MKKPIIILSIVLGIILLESYFLFFALAFSFLIGCFSGFLPAKRAADLKPTEALRRFE